MSRIEKSKISRAIAKLEDRGWIDRIYSKENRRGHDLSLTRQGEKIFAELSEMALEFNAKLEDQLGSAAMAVILEQLRSLEKKIDELPDDD